MATAMGDVLRIVAKFSDGSNDIQNVYHVRVTDQAPNNDGAVLDGCAEFMDDCYTSYANAMPDDITFDSVAVYNLTQDYPLGETDWPVLTAGAKTSNKLPPQNSPLVLFTTAVLNSLGKKYLPNLTVTDLEDDGTISSTVLTVMGALATSILTGYVSGTWNLEAGNYRPNSATWIPYVASVVRDLFATQRRRYAGKGS